VGKTKKIHEMKVPTAMLSKFTENAEKINRDSIRWFL